MFSWGDGTQTGWIESSEASHTWTQKGNYQVKTRAMLTHETDLEFNNAEDYKVTEWSESLTVSLSKTKTNDNTNPLWMLWLQQFFEKYPNAFPILRQLLGL